jgi:ParB family chromosome partitioning protein
MQANQKQLHLKLQMHIKYFTNYFGTKVDVKVAGMAKEKSLPFHSEEDFNRIIKLINE